MFQCYDAIKVGCKVLENWRVEKGKENRACRVTADEKHHAAAVFR